MMDARVRNGLVAVSAVNLVFFPRWADLLTAPEQYVLSVPVPGAAYWGVVLLVAALASAAWMLALVARTYDVAWLRGLLKLGLLLTVAIGVDWIVQAVRIATGHATTWAAPVAAYVSVTVVVIGIALARWRGRHVERPVVRVVMVCALLLFPLAPVLAAQGAFQSVGGGDRLRDVQGAGPDWLPVQEGSQRTVVLVFDELDAHLTFEARPPEIELPHLDRLRNESIAGQTVYAAHSETMRSLPAMTTGRFVEEAMPVSWSDLVLTLDDGTETSWSATPNMFQDAHDAGQNVGIVGYFHPYCRLFPELAASCTNRGFELPDAGIGLWSRLHLRDQVGNLVPHSGLLEMILDAVDDRGHMLDMYQAVGGSAYRGLEEAALQDVVDERLGLVFVHMNVPHPVGLGGATRGFYDPHGHAMATGSGADYWDNVILADHTLDRFRAAMEDAGVWNDTHLIVTSDHGYRTQFWVPPPQREGPAHDLLDQPTEHRVPFLYKPPHLDAPSTALVPFNNVVLRDLVQAIRDGAVHDFATFDKWLDGTMVVKGDYRVF